MNEREEIVAKLVKSYSDMITEISGLVIAGADMGIAYVDSHVLLEVCRKNLELSKVYTAKLYR